VDATSQVGGYYLIGEGEILPIRLASIGGPPSHGGGPAGLFGAFVLPSERIYVSAPSEHGAKEGHLGLGSCRLVDQGQGWLCNRTGRVERIWLLRRLTLRTEAEQVAKSQILFPKLLKL
jgi:hypothetical protein